MPCAARPLGLTRSEFDLLQELLQGRARCARGRTWCAWSAGEYYGEDTYISEADERAVEVHIGNLRRKLHEDPQDPRVAANRAGCGVPAGAEAGGVGCGSA